MAESPNHLIIVCGHGVWRGGPSRGWDESEWAIEKFQSGETSTFIAHIKAGVEVAVTDRRALLIFSGGSSRAEERLSEAESYARLARANSFFGFCNAMELRPDGEEDLTNRIRLEERALDSYQNILFSIIEFWRASGYQRWPDQLTIVSHAFKRSRLVEGHCAAIGFPLDRVSFMGINPPAMAALLGGASVGGDEKQRQDTNSSLEKLQTVRGVHEALDQWQQDPHGVGPLLAGKRQRRNRWGVSQRLFLNDDEVARSGIKINVLPGGGECLSDDAPKPWAVTMSNLC